MSIRERAAIELERIDFGKEDSAAMLQILDIFFDNWDSGGAVSVAAPILQRIIAGQPLSPLTGKDDEWIYYKEDGVYQNKRYSSVFKQDDYLDGKPYDIGLPQVEGKWQAINFPYYPDYIKVISPLVEVVSKN